MKVTITRVRVTVDTVQKKQLLHFMGLGLFSLICTAFKVLAPYLTLIGSLACPAIFFHMSQKWDSGSTVVLVLYYKSDGRWFDSRWCH